MGRKDLEFYEKISTFIVNKIPVDDIKVDSRGKLIFNTRHLVTGYITMCGVDSHSERLILRDMIYSKLYRRYHEEQ